MCVIIFVHQRHGIDFCSMNFNYFLLHFDTVSKMNFQIDPIELIQKQEYHSNAKNVVDFLPESFSFQTMASNGTAKHITLSGQFECDNGVYITLTHTQSVTQAVT